jgi:hypothetical protein
VEDLAQEPCSKSTLEVLQSFLVQQKALLSKMGRVDPSESSLINFNYDQVHQMLSHQINFQIKVRMMGKNIFHTVIDEGDSNCIISMSCWKALDSPKLDTTAKLLTSFVGHMFHPHGIISSLPTELGGNILYVFVEVVDAHPKYNLLLENSWFYKMTAIVSSVFRVLCFPHQGKIMTIDQISFFTSYLGSNAGSDVPFFNDPQQSCMSVSESVQRFFAHGNILSSPTTSYYEHFSCPYDLFFYKWISRVS